MGPSKPAKDELAQISIHPGEEEQKNSASSEVGYVTAVNNYLVWINGLPNIKINEIVISENKTRAVVVSIRNDLVEALILDDSKVTPNEMFVRTFSQFSISVGSHILGRTINPLGQPIDGKGRFGHLGQNVEIERSPPGIKMREQITKQFETGITLIDMLMPIAFGQRELIIGDLRSGKTSSLIDIVVNQKGKDIICVLGIIGKPITEIRNLFQVLTVNKAIDYCSIIASSSSDKASLVYLTPAVAISVAEYFQRQGKKVLLVLDDMGIHAKFYREIALLSGLTPGRESYPGDIFYQHAKLVERAGNFKAKYGGNSITALPIIETNLDDFASFMPTNLMAMTDGHLLFNAARYHQGYRPSIDISLSVSRVGRQTQMLAQKRLSDKVKALLGEASKLETFSRLDLDISPQTRFIIKQAHQIRSLLKQRALLKIPIPVSMIILGLVFTTFFSEKDENFVDDYKEKITQFLISNIDTSEYSKQISKYKDEKEFINSLTVMIPQLEQVCKQG